MGIPFAVPEHPWRLGFDLLQPPSCGLALVGCPGTAAPKIVPPSLADKGLAHRLRHSYQASPHYNRPRGVCRDHAPGSAIFSSSVNVSEGVEVLLFLLWNGIAAFTGLLCLLWALPLSGEFYQLS